MLDKFADHIMGCRVVVEPAGKHHEHGNLYEVRIDLTVPALIPRLDHSLLHPGPNSDPRLRLLPTYLLKGWLKLDPIPRLILEPDSFQMPSLKTFPFERAFANRL